MVESKSGQSDVSDDKKPASGPYFPDAMKKSKGAMPKTIVEESKPLEFPLKPTDVAEKIK